MSTPEDTYRARLAALERITSRLQSDVASLSARVKVLETQIEKPGGGKR